MVSRPGRGAPRPHAPLPSRREEPVDSAGRRPPSERQGRGRDGAGAPGCPPPALFPCPTSSPAALPVPEGTRPRRACWAQGAVIEATGSFSLTVTEAVRPLATAEAGRTSLRWDRPGGRPWQPAKGGGSAVGSGVDVRGRGTARGCVFAAPARWTHRSLRHRPECVSSCGRQGKRPILQWSLTAGHVPPCA